MRVLFVGMNDWANIAHRLAFSLCRAGHDARVLVLQSHSFTYDDAHAVALPSTKAACAWAEMGMVDWCISSGDGDYQTYFALLNHLPKIANLATMHVGTAYRVGHVDYNKVDAARFKCRLIGGDLFRFVEDTAKAFPIFAPPHDVFDRLPMLRGPVRFAHAPSRRSVKGTGAVLAAVPDVDVLEKLPFRVCMQRRLQAHVYIDQLNDLGGFGAAAVEALATGAAVLGSTVHIGPAVDAFYERPPIVEVTPQTLGAVVARLRADPEHVTALRAASLAWAQRVATPGAIGAYVARQLASV